MSDAAQKSLADALGCQPGAVLRVYGMRRSGNHAIINWLLRNADGGSIFLNNCAVGRLARRTWKSIEVNGRPAKTQKGEAIAPVTGTAGDGALVVISYEDFCPDLHDNLDGVTADLSASDVTHEVVFYRNFMNWAASLLRKFQLNHERDNLNCLRMMLNAIESYRDMLELVLEAKSLGVVPVNFDRWIDRPVYREKLLSTLGLPCKDNTLGMVQQYGGGSSFQKNAVRAEDLKTDQRWLEMANDPSFQILLLAASQDDALLAMMRQLMPKDAELLANYLEQAQFPYIVQMGET